MKVLILTSNYPRKNALNNGVFIHQQVKALQQLGVDCHVLTYHNWYPPFGLHKYHQYWRDGYDAHSVYFEEYEGVKIYAVPMFVRMPSRFFKEGYFDRAVRSLLRFVKKTPALHNADWLYAHFLTDNAYIASRVKDQLNLKIAAIARGDDVHAWPEQNPALQAHFPLVFEKVDLLMANSRNLGNDAQKWMEPGKERNVEVVYNGIEHSRFRPVNGNDERREIRIQFKMAENMKYLTCVATPIVLKGWVELLEAVKLLGVDFGGWQLLMVAPRRLGPDALDLEEMGKQMGISDRLYYMGSLSPDELARVLRASDAFVLPSYNEGMANSLLEAMASGLPCIATEVGGHNEVIAHGVDGLLVQPKTIAELAAAIKTIVSDGDLRKQLGENARNRMITFGDYRQNSAKLKALLEQYSK